MIDAMHVQMSSLEEASAPISQAELDEFVSFCEGEIDRALDARELGMVSDILQSLKMKIKSFSKGSDKKDKGINEKLINLESEKKDLFSEVEKIKEIEVNLQNELSVLEKEDKEYESTLRESEKLRYELIREKNEISSKIQSFTYEEEKLLSIKSLFEDDVREAQVLIGPEVLLYLKQGYENDMTPKNWT